MNQSSIKQVPRFTHMLTDYKVELAPAEAYASRGGSRGWASTSCPRAGWSLRPQGRVPASSEAQASWPICIRLTDPLTYPSSGAVPAPRQPKFLGSREIPRGSVTEAAIIGRTRRAAMLLPSSGDTYAVPSATSLSRSSPFALEKEETILHNTSLTWTRRWYCHLLQSLQTSTWAHSPQWLKITSTSLNANKSQGKLNHLTKADLMISLRL